MQANDNVAIRLLVVDGEEPNSRLISSEGIYLKRGLEIRASEAIPA